MQKPLSKAWLLSVAAILPFHLATISDAATLAGWETWSSGGAPASTTSGGASASFTNGSGTWNIRNEAASTDGTFGTLAGASTATGFNSAGYQVFTGSGAVDFSITAGAKNLILDTFHFDLGRKRFNSPENWSAEILSGPISTGSLGSGGLSTLGGPGPHDLQDFDQDLTGLADNILEAGQTATFRISLSGGSGANDQRSYIDNVAISGTAVPEPSSALLAALGLSSLLIRRRK